MIDLHSVNADTKGAAVRIADAKSLEPYEYGLEYGAPARGPWNIVHIGMLLPESHQIFICAQGCLRGVVLTAGEMFAQRRFSTISICENNVLDGDMESMIIDGTVDILSKLPYRPRAVLMFTSCIHHFIGCDLNFVYGELRKKYPDIDFTDCYMNPIMRKTITPPDPKMREQLYSVLHKAPLDESSINIIGCNEALKQTSELMVMLHRAGYDVKDICNCGTYDEFQKMASSSVDITVLPTGNVAAETLAARLGHRHLYLPESFDYDEIDRCIAEAAKLPRVKLPDVKALRAEAELEISRTREMVGDMPVAVDYTSTPRPLGMAEMLIRNGFNVVSVYNDVFSPEEQKSFDWLRENAGDLMLRATVNPKTGMLPRLEAQENGGKLLAIGQKAAYFTGTSYFVNILEGGGLWGYDGIGRLMELMREAVTAPKETRKIIQVKGWGCRCC